MLNLQKKENVKKSLKRISNKYELYVNVAFISNLGTQVACKKRQKSLISILANFFSWLMESLVPKKAEIFTVCKNP